VRDGEAGALVTAVRDGHGVADRGLGTGFFPAAGVVPVARQGPTNHDYQAGIGIDDDLVSR
jgi:hypothetical protein